MERKELLAKYQFILSEHQRITEKEQELKHLKSEHEKILQEEKQKREKMGTGTWFITVIPFFVGAYFLYRSIKGLFNGVVIDAIIFFTCVVACKAILELVFTISFAIYDRKKNEMEVEKYHNEVTIPEENKLNQCAKELQNIKTAEEFASAIESIPEEYRTIEAISFFCHALQVGRADTEKEVYNLYEEELYRKRLEKIQKEQLKKIDDSLVHCPKCGGTHCNMMVKTKTDHTPFGIGNACCGYILFGPIGFLCGACGMGTSTETETYWYCEDCGKKFTK